MEGSKKILDLHFDFIVFIFGLAFVITGFSNIYMLQQENFEQIVNGSHSLVYVSGTYDEYVPGADILLYLTGDDSVTVEYEGSMYNPSERELLMEKLDVSGCYLIERYYQNEAYGIPSTISISKKIEEGAGE